MKQANKFKILLTTLVFIQLNLFAQTVVNEEWATYSALSDTIDIAQSFIDINGNIIITGNILVAGQQANIITTKLDQNGNIIWQQQFNGASNGKDYGTAITVDGNGSVYVAGATYTNTTNDQDFVSIKYDASGNLMWSQQYNGTGSGFDEPSAITVDNSGNLFVTGQSKGQNSLQDYATVKYNWYGVEQWVKRYDFANLNDLPCAIVADNLGGVTVTGSSDSTATNADYATINYDLSGNQTAILRHSLATLGLDKATSMKKDYTGNIYITGGEYINGSYLDIKTIKLNSNLAVQWVQTYDGEGFDDFANSIDLDDNGYVYVSGYTTKANGEKEILLLKYQSNGTQIWVRKQSAPDGSDIAEAKKIAVDYNGNVYLTGEINTGVNKNSITIKYDTDGNKKWEKLFNRTGNEHIKPLDIKQIHDTVYVTAKSKQGTQDKFVTVKYEESEHPSLTVYDSIGSPTHIANEIIVRFDRSSLLMNSINTKATEFGTLNKFVNTATIALMNTKIGLAGSTMGNFTAIKIFKNLLPSDSISISRLGDTVKIPDFWATFIIELPANMQEQTIADSLNKCTPNIWYAELNPVIKAMDVPNDIKYAYEQSSLHSTSLYPNANINVESAWDKETGKSFVKVGVYDSGIDQDHDDLNGKVQGGYDYLTSTSLSAPYDSTGHGTACAGIIGALRNNTTGIAGIAGGDMANNNNSGCSLYNLRIINGAGRLGTGAYASNAIITGAISTSNGGYGLNIMSNSWGTVPDNPYLISGFDGILHDAVEFANNNKVTFIASRGNDGNDDAKYPACYSDQLVINVSASGTDGERKSASNGDNWWASSYGNSVDIMAPGTTEIVTTLQSGTNSTETFNGTSASTPHVAGVAALMMSYLNNPNMPDAFINLAPEDVEAILQLSATDKGAAGYDDYAGWGLLNASQAMNLIEKPKYKIQHIQTFNNAATTITPSLSQSNKQIELITNYQGVAAGTYFADVFQSTFDLDYTLSSPTDQILHTWPRFSSSQGWGLLNPITDEVSTENYVQILSATNTHAVLRNFFYHLKYNSLGQAMDVWFPSNGNSNAGFTFHTYDPNAVGVDEIKDQNTLNLFYVFPNPANNSATFSYYLPENEKISLQLFDVQGRLIKTIFNGTQQKGIHSEELDLSAIAQGLYVYVLTTEKKKIQKKLSIMH